ncbi:hypothetical protein A3Q56_03809 [Intoshia linei]|uniref:GTP cyclohydrolase 1 n=1 Tax=Intoshia linei TaxID=1819745 RepID=A0A177B2J2_9BILA|nr:hypothetical protein A3Q56_03809 [Intoshia linei]
MTEKNSHEELDDKFKKTQANFMISSADVTNGNAVIANSLSANFGEHSSASSFSNSYCSFNYEPYVNPFSSLLSTLTQSQPGVKFSKDVIKHSPVRAAKAFSEMTSGYNEDLQDLMRDGVYETESESIIVVDNINMQSLCEHHLLPFYGKVTIAYLPNKKIMGLSKFERIVQIFSKRLQLQEKLINQIVACIEDIIRPRGLYINITATHMCILMRGIKNANSVTTTYLMRGLFKTNPNFLSQLMFVLYNKDKCICNSKTKNKHK